MSWSQYYRQQYLAWRNYQYQRMRLQQNYSRRYVRNPVAVKKNALADDFKDWYDSQVKVTNANAEKKARELYNRFYHFPHRHVSRVNFKVPEALVYLGETARLDYITDKFKGKETVRYFHEFGEGYPYPQLYSNEEGDMLVIVNNFKIKPEGIINAKKKTY